MLQEMKMVTLFMKVVALMMRVIQETKRKDFLQAFLVVVEDHETERKTNKMKEIFLLLMMKLRKRESNICGIRLDVTTISLDFKLDCKKWRSLI